MNVLYLPGFSIKNKDEAILNSKVLESNGFDVFIHEWRHWALDVKWDATKEVEIIKSEVSFSEPLIIVAKSIGTYVTTLLDLNPNIKALILMGIPVNDLDPSELISYQNLKQLNIPITVIQNINDSHGSSNQVKELLKDINYSLMEKDQNDHVYEYPEDILSIVKDY